MFRLSVNEGNVLTMFNGCEKQTENSVTRVTVPYRDDCLVIPMTSQSEW